MGAPQVEAWSCSTEERYPDDADELRKITTGLFEKTIKLRSTIERLYEADARIFVEVGPKGGLVPYIAEVLAEKQHLALATNLAGKSGVDQLNALLAVLACHGVEMNLESLYHRRVAAERFSQPQASPDLFNNQQGLNSPQAPDFAFDKSADALERSVDFELSSLQSSNLFRDFFSSSQGMSNTDDMINNLLDSGVDLFSGGMLSDEVMITYLSTMQQFHESMMGTHERLLLSYLSGTESNADISLEEEYHSVEFAFLPNAAVQANQDCFTLAFTLSTVRQPFLLDHAIGGNVTSQTAPSRVCLLPLMVALEIMAEGASLLCGDLQVARLSDIRAYKRIRTDKRDLPLILELREAKNGGIEARICLDVPTGEEAEVFASCVVEFEHVLPEAPPPAIFPVQEEQRSRLSPNQLYGAGSMFHGPAMQSVESIDLVARRSIEGRIHCRHADKWFQNQAPEIAPHMVIDPLLLDNASQFVLYQMYEHNLAATALLPFHVGSIEFFQGYHSLRGETVFASAHLRSMSQRGTEAQIQLVDPAGYTVARVNDISSRAIILPDVFRDFIADPSRLICKRVNSTVLERSDMPQDETALDWLTDYILTENEQREWRQLGKTEKRRMDWLMGRIAAKDAVRLLAKQAFGLTLKCADIQISKTEIGNVEAQVFNFELAWTPQISISHCQTTAVAIAEPPRATHQAGIDVEEIKERDQGFAEFSFTKNELKWLSAKPAEEKALHIAKLWTAKEAAAKASCSGFSGNPKLFELQSAASDDNSFKIKAQIDDPNRAGTYTCYVSSSDKLSLAVVVAFAP
jgi:phosphopantetheine--protein transferase-like protein